MKVKTKKKNQDGIVRLETSGNLKEILINEDLLKPKDVNIALCFKGKSSSGIIELNLKEIEAINKEIKPRLELLQNVKVMKFKK